MRDKGKHLVVKAGDKVPIKGLDVQIVIAGGVALAKPLAGAGEPNPLCGNVAAMPPDPSEDASSVGSIISLGSFRMIDLGDLTWNKEKELACPNNLVGTGRPLRVHPSRAERRRSAGAGPRAAPAGGGHQQCG